MGDELDPSEEKLKGESALFRTLTEEQLTPQAHAGKEDGTARQQLEFYKSKCEDAVRIIALLRQTPVAPQEMEMFDLAGMYVQQPKKRSTKKLTQV